jgi:hypothetical protein
MVGSIVKPIFFQTKRLALKIINAIAFSLNNHLTTNHFCKIKAYFGLFDKAFTVIKILVMT